MRYPERNRPEVDKPRADLQGGEMSWIYSLEWHNPMTDPPDGQERVKRWIRATSANDQAAIAAVVGESKPGDGWSLYIAPEPRISKIVNAAGLAKRRLARKRTEFQKKHPLFADQELEKDQQDRPEYYTEEGCQDAEQHRIKAELDYINRFWSLYSSEREVRLAS